MQIFKKRPLSLILCIVLGGFSFCVNQHIEVQLSILSIPLILFILTLIKGTVSKEKIILMRIASLSLLTAILLGILFTSAFLPKEHYDKETTLKGTVTDVKETHTYQRVTIETERIGGQSAKYKLLYYNYDKYLKVGDYIEADCEIQSIEDLDQMRSSYFSEGISASVKLENPRVSTAAQREDGFFEGIRKRISESLKETSNESTGGLLSALLIGDKSDLNPSLALSFRRLGLSHVLALSGMHLAILTHAIERIMLYLGIRKKRRMIATSVFTLMYMSLVGFTPSITRAGVMLIIYYFLHLIAHTSDTLTTLSLTVFLIICFNPTSVYDVSLWLSAFATLGILTLCEMRSDKKKSKFSFGLLRYIRNSLISSIFAIILTLIITVNTFNTISPMSIISTALFTPIIEIFIYIGMLLPLVGWFLPLGSLAVLIHNLIIKLSDFLSRPWWVCSYADNLPVRALTVLLTVMVVLFLILEVKRRNTYIISIVGVLLLTMTTATLINGAGIYEERAVYLSDETYDTVMISGGGEVSFIVSDVVSSPSMRYISKTAGLSGITKIDRLILTGYSSDFKQLDTLVNYTRIDFLYIPVPSNQYELEAATLLSSILSNYSTSLRFYNITDTLYIGDVEYNLNYFTPLEYGKHYSSVYTLSINGNSITYLSENSHKVIPQIILFGCETSDMWILGVGSNKGSPYDIYLSPKDKIITGRDNRMKDEVREYYTELGIEIVQSNKYDFK